MFSILLSSSVALIVVLADQTVAVCPLSTYNGSTIICDDVTDGIPNLLIFFSFTSQLLGHHQPHNSILHTH